MKPKTPTAQMWEKLRPRYEAGDEKVADIAQSLNVSAFQLIAQAKAKGWRLRKAKTASAKSAAPKTITTTRQAIGRLKALVQARITRLEAELKSLGQDVGTLSAERSIRATNTLARTLEKVLELEQADRKQRLHKASAQATLPDAWREDLAGRLAKLQPTSVDQPGGGKPGAASGAAG